MSGTHRRSVFLVIAATVAAASGELAVAAGCRLDSAVAAQPDANSRRTIPNIPDAAPRRTGRRTPTT